MKSSREATSRPKSFLDWVATPFVEEDRKRAKILAIGFVSVFLATFLELIAGIDDPWQRRVITLILSFGALVGIPVLRWTRSIRLSASFIGTCAAINFLGQFIVSHEKFFLMLFVAIPVFIILVADRMHGLAWSLLCSTIVLVTCAFHQAGWMGDPFVEYHRLPLLDGVTVCVTIMALSAVALASDSIRQRAEAEKERLNSELLKISHQAGMAEIATGILHNVGNVLNSINVSSNVIQARLRNSALDGLQKATALIDMHQEDLGDFISEDRRGQALPKYLTTVAQTMSQERAEVLVEFDSVLKHLEHIKNIIGVQQSVATVSGHHRELDLEELIDDAVSAIHEAVEQHDIQIIKEIETDPTVVSDRHKVLQILVNLLSNSKDALVDADRAEKTIHVRLQRQDDQYLVIEVSDNGIGIDPRILDRIFEHGFTTKRLGHGFGLHSCVNAAKRLGGTIEVFSAGPDQGSSFRLVIPRLSARDGSPIQRPSKHKALSGAPPRMR